MSFSLVKSFPKSLRFLVLDTGGKCGTIDGRWGKPDRCVQIRQKKTGGLRSGVALQDEPQRDTGQAILEGDELG